MTLPELPTANTEPLRRRFTDSAGEAFSYLVWDRSNDPGGRPPFHWAHANGFNAMTYQRLLAPLGDEMSVFAMDARGFGMSEAKAEPGAMRGWDNFVTDLLSFVDQLGEPIVLGGHSMGGVVSLMAAAARPELVKGLVLADPVLMAPPKALLWGIKRLLGSTRNTPLAAGAARRRSVFESREAMVENYTGRGAFKTWPDGWIADYVAGGTVDLPDGTVSLSCTPAWESHAFAMGPPTFWPPVERITCPIVILYAETGSTFGDTSAETLSRRKPDATIIKVPGSSHFLPMEFADLVRDQVRSLYAGL